MKAQFANILTLAGSNRRDLLRGVIISFVFIILSFQSFSLFESIERFLYGIEMRFALAPTAGSGKIAIVNIDEKSMDEIGSWPWPRSKIAEMIKILSDNGASFIGLDLDGLNNREPVDVDGETFWLAPIEYVILRKLEYYREGESEKHSRDISSILAFSSDEIDFKMLEERIKKRNLEKEWQAAKDFKI